MCATTFYLFGLLELYSVELLVADNYLEAKIASYQEVFMLT